MINPEFLLVRLPQTLIRGLAIPNFTSLKIIQANVERESSVNNLMTLRQKATLLINTEVLHSLGMDDPVSVIDIFDEDSLIPERAIIDSNLAHNAKLPSFRNCLNPVILPYASSVFNPTYSDLTHVKGFTQCLRESLYILKSIRPQYIYDWTGVICKTQFGQHVPWFWKPLSMDLNKYINRIQVVSQYLGEKYPFLNQFRNAVNPILLLYSSEWHHKTIEEVLINLYNSSQQLRNQIELEGSTIFVKPHRAWSFLPKESINYFKGSKVLYADCLAEHLIPTEVFINSKQGKFLLISEWSSTLFNFQIKNFIPIPDPRPSYDFTLLLAGHRLKSSINFNPYDNF